MTRSLRQRVDQLASRLSQPLSALVVAAGCVLGTPAVQAGPYSDVVFFGDSLSDTGNVLALLPFFGGPAFPSFPGAEGRFSNGPSFVETLAAGLGLAGAAEANRQVYLGGGLILPTGAPGGNNYAYGGARTLFGGAVDPNTTGLITQYVVWNGGEMPMRMADPNALYVVIAGGNDLRDARTANPTMDAAGDAARTVAAVQTATNISNVVGQLALQGARHVLVSNLPDLGRTPEAFDDGVVAASTDITLKFNGALATAMAQLDAALLGGAGIDLDVRFMDLFTRTELVVDDALNNGGAVYGITNTTAPCIAPGPFSGQYFFADATDINCGVSLYSDDLHPSARGHQIIGEYALAVALPEPGVFGLVLLAAGGVLVLRRR